MTRPTDAQHQCSRSAPAAVQQFQSPMRQHKRTPSQHREVKVCALPPPHPRVSLRSEDPLLTFCSSWTGNPQCAIRIYQRRCQRPVAPRHKPVYHLGGDRTRFLRSCPPRSGSVRPGICTWTPYRRDCGEPAKTYATSLGRQRIFQDPPSQTRPVQHPATRSPAPTPLPSGSWPRPRPRPPHGSDRVGPALRPEG